MTEDEFAAYQSLTEEPEDHRWAFGTGFTDPLEGIETYPARTQTALIIQELRNQRAILRRVNSQQWWILTTLVGLLLSIIVGLSLFIATGGP